VLPVLAAGTQRCIGVALIAGTGSVAFGRNAIGQTKLCGGWGYLLGDAGSAYDIGRAALRHALQNLETDAAAPEPLTDAIRSALGAHTVMELTRAIYMSAQPRSTIASLAPHVVELAGQGDPTSQAILESAAGELATLVSRTVELLALGDGTVSLAVAGGLLVSSRQLQDRLQASLQRMKLECELTMVEEPLAGCLRLAAPELAGTLVTWHHT